MMHVIPPDITYACEMEAVPLQALFANPEIIEFLQATHATVSMAILDHSPQRVEVVRCLNKAGIPVTAWLLLPKDQGYWFNLDNYPQAVTRYETFKAWSKDQELHWARIGLDIEPDMRTMQLLSGNRIAAARQMMGRVMNSTRLHQGLKAYHALVARIHQDGYAVETYQMPFIVDERMAGSWMVQRVTGIVDLPEADREILMLYSSFLRPWGQGVLWSYASQARGIGVGITGKGVEKDSTVEVPPLNWTELETDLLLAHKHSENIFIYNLEGCVKQQFLSRLRNFDWQKPVEVPYSAAQRAENVRGLFRRGLWLLARPAWVLLGLAMLTSALTLLGRRLKK